MLQAGKNKLTLDEIVRLHTVLIEDTRFTRQACGRTASSSANAITTATHCRNSSARALTIYRPLMQGMIAANERMRDGEIDTVLQAAATAFGFVYIHPFQDGQRPASSLPDPSRSRGAEIHATGNGLPRLPGHARPHRHIPRYAARAFRPTNGLYRVAADAGAERRSGQRYGRPLSLFRLHRGGEFLYGCVERAIDKDLPREIDFLRRNDEAIRRVMNTVEMPDRIAENLIRYIRLNENRLGRKRREGEFAPVDGR